MPTWMLLSTYSALTFASEASVLTPSGIIGWSDTSSSAPQGMLLAKPAAKIVAVSMSMAMQRIRRRSEEHTSELQSLMRISYAVFCLKKKTTHKPKINKRRKHTKPKAHKRIHK